MDVEVIGRATAGSDNSREVGISSGNQALTRCAFLGTDGTSSSCSVNLKLAQPGVPRTENLDQGRVSFGTSSNLFSVAASTAFLV
jgi:hypothetical protein